MSDLDAIIAELGRAGAAAERDAETAVGKVAERFRDQARADVAVDSGDTRNSIRVEGSGDERTIVADSEAAFYLEFGTSDTRPQPFMWPQVPTATRALAEALGDINPFD